MDNKIIFITGATSGFGKAIAYMFAQHGWNLILTGRRQERLSSIEKEIISNYPVKVMTLCFDIRNRKQTEQMIHDLPYDWKEIDVLVNNAGLASGLSLIQDGDVDDWELMIDTNVKGLLYVSRLVMPMMIKRKNGHIINISSIAGKEAYLRGNVYCATKHAVDALTKSMRIDLLPHGIKVSSIDPGAAETEFSLVRLHGDEERAKKVYEGYTPLHADDIADITYFVASRPAHVVINDIIVTPLAQANTSYIVKK